MKPIPPQKIEEWRTRLTASRRKLGPYTKCARNGPSFAIEQAEIAREVYAITELLLEVLEEITPGIPNHVWMKCTSCERQTTPGPLCSQCAKRCQCGHLKIDHRNKKGKCIPNCIEDCHCKKYIPQ